MSSSRDQISLMSVPGICLAVSTAWRTESGLRAPVNDVRLARPDQLDERAGHLLGDQHCLANEIVAGGPPAEAAAKAEAVNFAFSDRQVSRAGRRRERRLAVLSR